MQQGISVHRKIGLARELERGSRQNSERAGICFFGYREMLTKPQWKLLKTIAMSGSVYRPTSSDFMVRYFLGSSATVLRSLNSLLRMELIYKENDKDGNLYYGVYDVLFGRWISR